MAEQRNESRFDLVLTDKVSASARSIAAGMRNVKGDIEAANARVRSMVEQLKLLKRNKEGNATAIAALQKRLVGEKAALRSLSNELKSLTERQKKDREERARMRQELTSLPGPLGAVARGFFSLQDAVDAPLGPLSLLVGGATAAIGIFVALSTAVLATGVAMARFALASSDARRSELLQLEGLTTLRNAYGIAAGSATDLQRAIDRVADSSALSRTEVAGMAQGLYRAHLRGQALRDALEGLSIAQAVQGDRGAQRFRALAVSAALAGRSVSDLTARYRARLGPIADRMALALPRQMDRLRESIASIFSGVRTEGLLRALHTIVSLFSASSVSGRALAQLVSVIFSPLFDSAERGAPTVRRFFLGMIIGAQRVVIGFLRLRDAIGEPFRRIRDSLPDVDLLGVAIAGVTTLGYGLVGAMLVVSRIAGAFQALREGAQEAFKAMARVLGPQGATNLVDGFVGAVVAAIPGIGGVMAGFGRAAADGLRAALGIHSPSRVFAQLGSQVPRGFALGIERGSGDAAEAAAGMGTGSASAAAIGGAVRGAGSTSISFGDVHVHLASGGADEGREAARAFMDELGTALEQASIELGGRT